MIDEVRVAPYAHVAASAAADGSGELYHWRLKNIDWRTRSDAQIDSLFANGQAVAEARLRLFFKYMDALRPALGRSTYEWGQECSAAMSGYVGTAYLGTISTSDNTLVWEASTPATFPDGDAWRFYDSVIPIRRAPIARHAHLHQGQGCDARLVLRQRRGAARRCQQYRRRRDRARTPRHARRSTRADNLTRTQQFGTRLKAYLDGPAGTGDVPAPLRRDDRRRQAARRLPSLRFRRLQPGTTS